MSEDMRTLLGIAAAFFVCGVALNVPWAHKKEDEGEASGGPKASEGRQVREMSVPRIGGAALLAGLLVSGANLPWYALVAAFMLGTWDDLAGLTPRAKAFLQVIPAGLLAWPSLGLHGPTEGVWMSALGIFAIAWVAQNAVNTWDHADGMALGLGALALPPLLAGPLVGVLPWNLVFRGPGPGGRDLPKLYLGDAGSHLLAVLLVSHPTGRWFVIVPLLDLLRVAWVRWRAGQRPWVGDRRHFAHRFQERGVPPKAVALLGLVPALPLLAISEWGLALCLAACVLTFAVMIWMSKADSQAVAESPLD